METAGYDKLVGAVLFSSGGGGSNFRVKVYVIPSSYFRDKGNENLLKNLSVLPIEGKFFCHTGLDGLIT